MIIAGDKTPAFSLIFSLIGIAFYLPCFIVIVEWFRFHPELCPYFPTIYRYSHIVNGSNPVTSTRKEADTLKVSALFYSFSIK